MSRCYQVAVPLSNDHQTSGGKQRNGGRIIRETMKHYTYKLPNGKINSYNSTPERSIATVNTIFVDTADQHKNTLRSVEETGKSTVSCCKANESNEKRARLANLLTMKPEQRVKYLRLLATKMNKNELNKIKKTKESYRKQLKNIKDKYRLNSETEGLSNEAYTHILSLRQSVPAPELYRLLIELIKFDARLISGKEKQIDRYKVGDWSKVIIPDGWILPNRWQILTLMDRNNMKPPGYYQEALLESSGQANEDELEMFEIAGDESLPKGIADRFTIEELIQLFPVENQHLRDPPNHAVAQPFVLSSDDSDIDELPSPLDDDEVEVINWHAEIEANLTTIGMERKFNEILENQTIFDEFVQKNRKLYMRGEEKVNQFVRSAVDAGRVSNKYAEKFNEIARCCTDDWIDDTVEPEFEDRAENINSSSAFIEELAQQDNLPLINDEEPPPEFEYTNDIEKAADILRSVDDCEVENLIAQIMPEELVDEALDVEHLKVRNLLYSEDDIMNSSAQPQTVKTVEQMNAKEASKYLNEIAERLETSIAEGQPDLSFVDDMLNELEEIRLTWDSSAGQTEGNRHKFDTSCPGPPY